MLSPFTKIFQGIQIFLFYQIFSPLMFCFFITKLLLVSAFIADMRL